ncbi:MAG: DUF4169 family protein [Pseudomonadota bacterium]|nr:DUF4169 family protein [Pseudomonadota bacterium]
MNDVVNLNKFRKRKKAAEKQAKASQNRVKFGRSKAQKTQEKQRLETLAKHLDGHRRDGD